MKLAFDERDAFPSYYRYWGKARKDGATFHLLPYHCLDVAAVGKVLFAPQQSICRDVAESLGVRPECLHDFFIFCLALHDLGKFSSAFQGLRKDLSADLVRANPRITYCERHDSLGFWLWRDVLSKNFRAPDSKGNEWFGKAEPWMKIVTGHHGIPPKQSGGRVQMAFEAEDEAAAALFVRDVSALLLVNFDSSPLIDKELKKRLKMASWQLAGIAVMADWLGSNSKHFIYHQYPIPLNEYWDTIALPSARRAVEGLPVLPNARPFASISDLFSFVTNPTPLQEYAVNEPLNGEPQLFILEDVTGAGKTEAAVVLTHRLLDAGLADGLYVALPTMATANAIYERLGRVYRRLYDAESAPSLILAHGARNLSDAFRESVRIPENQFEEANYNDFQNSDAADLSASAYCNAWLADNRKKALLADVGVGTLDQALLAVLPARHQSLRLFGLSRKVLLIDEVHAYDSYMQQLLDTLLEAHARQGGSVILLSATLPRKMRKNLIEAFYRGRGQTLPEIKNTAYPLATHSSEASMQERHLDTRDKVKRTVSVVRLDEERDVFDQIKTAINKGQCVCWIRNTVKAARKSHAELLQHDWMDRDRLNLFHSRFAMIDRQRIENEVLRRFGAESTHEDRKGHVLIATQVVEQSLDLDFDVLITDLAPIDLILQRTGRLCRHVRDTNGKRVSAHDATDARERPVLYLFCPDPIKEAGKDWLKNHQKGTQAVYPHIGQLWRGARLLLKEKKGEFLMPDDARELIEGVYSDEAENLIPEKLMNASMEAQTKMMVQKSMADLNALKLGKGYTRSSGEWDEEARIPTRLTEEERVSVALAVFRDGKLHPYAGNAAHPWAMSVVNIPAREWEKACSQIPEFMHEKISDMKAEVKVLGWHEVFPLIEETKGYYSAVNGWQTEAGESL